MHTYTYGMYIHMYVPEKGIVLYCRTYYEYAGVLYKLTPYILLIVGQCDKDIFPGSDRERVHEVLSARPGSYGTVLYLFTAAETVSDTRAHLSATFDGHY